MSTPSDPEKELAMTGTTTNTDNEHLAELGYVPQLKVGNIKHPEFLSYTNALLK